MNPRHPEALGPTTWAIWTAILTELEQLGAYPAYIDRRTLGARVTAATACNPRTLESTLDKARRLGIAHGFKRIRLTPAGRYWLDHYGASSQ